LTPVWQLLADRIQTASDQSLGANASTTH